MTAADDAPPPSDTSRSGRPHPALAARRREVEREQGRRRRRVIEIGVGGLVCVLAGYWLAAGPVLAINSVNVSGYSGPDASQLSSALTAAAGHGGSLLSPPIRILRQVAIRFPGVQDIAISRSWPLALNVRVTPADPIAIVRGPSQTAVIVSPRGLVMGLAPAHLARASIVLSQPLPTFAHALPGWGLQGVQFLHDLSPRVRVRVQNLTYSQGQLTGQLLNGPSLVLGSLAQLPEKAAAINVVLASVSTTIQKKASYLDVTVPSRPALGGVGGLLANSSTSG